jgi:integrase
MQRQGSGSRPSIDIDPLPVSALLFSPGDERRGTEAIQQLTGHSSIAVTMRYMHLAPGALRTDIDLLEGITPA